MTLEKRATVIATSTATFLAIIKIIAGVFSGSIALIASAIDSILDIFVSLFNYFAITNSEKPADASFNYGRGKIEALASVIEGVIITISGIYLFFLALKKIFLPEDITYTEISIMVMIVSIIFTFALVLYLNYVAKKTNNMVIKADSLHYQIDLYTNFAVIFSLITVYFTDNQYIDAAIGGLIAIYIIYSAYELIYNGVNVLLDKAIDENIVNNIIQIINDETEVNDYHLLKTRESANVIFIEVHLVFNCLMTLMQAHKISDDIEIKIEALDTSKKWVINMHLDPYDDSIVNTTSP